MATEALPASLAAEGRLMLQSLLNELKLNTTLPILLPLDRRLADLSIPDNATVNWIDDADIARALDPLIRQADYVLPIAPESAGLLATMARQVISHNKILLASVPDGIGLCANKLATYQLLSRHRIACVETVTSANHALLHTDDYVIKPIDGLGCESTRRITDPTELAYFIGLQPKTEYIAQPFHAGQPVSLSCLFKQGQGWLICCNQQDISLQNQRFKLNGCRVNIDSDYRDYYQDLVDKIAGAIPTLWGYIGIDLIETAEHGPLVLEINPRFTSSYAGIEAATGIRISDQLIRLVHSEPDLRHSRRQTIYVKINGE